MWKKGFVCHLSHKKWNIRVIWIKHSCLIFTGRKDIRLEFFIRARTLEHSWDPSILYIDLIITDCRIFVYRLSLITGILYTVWAYKCLTFFLLIKKYAILTTVNWRHVIIFLVRCCRKSIRNRKKLPSISLMFLTITFILSKTLQSSEKFNYLLFLLSWSVNLN